MSPSDCPGQVCCTEVPLTGGSPPNCTNGTVTSSCKPASACPTKLGGFTCSGTEQLPLCTTKADCASDPGNNLCCTFTQDGGGTLSFCGNSLVTLGGGTCM
jgi:hypothetical protein